MNRIQNNMFKLFVKHDVENYELYIDVVEQTHRECHKECGELAATIYDQLRVLSDSVNNANWQNMHSEQIQMVNNIMRDIGRDYEEYLP